MVRGRMVVQLLEDEVRPIGESLIWKVAGLLPSVPCPGLFALPRRREESLAELLDAFLAFQRAAQLLL